MFLLLQTHIPPYASCLFFELYKSNEGGEDNFYLQLFYKNTTTENIPPFNIPGCGTKCSLEKFRKLFSHVIPTDDYETECKLPMQYILDSCLKPKIGKIFFYTIQLQAIS